MARVSAETLDGRPLIDIVPFCCSANITAVAFSISGVETVLLLFLLFPIFRDNRFPRSQQFLSPFAELIKNVWLTIADVEYKEGMEDR